MLLMLFHIDIYRIGGLQGIKFVCDFKKKVSTSATTNQTYLDYDVPE